MRRLGIMTLVAMGLAGGPAAAEDCGQAYVDCVTTMVYLVEIRDWDLLACEAEYVTCLKRELLRY